MALEPQNTTVTEGTPVTPMTAVNQTPAETTATETTATTETTEQTQEVSQETTPTAPQQWNADLYDERGVPWKNRALEFQRKLDEAQSTLPKLVAEEVAKTTQPQQKKYTIAELEAFAQANPEHRAWAEQEKAAVLKAELSQEINQRIEQTAKAQRDEVVRGQVFNKVLSTFPEIAIKDQQGNFLGWNNLSPMTQAIGRYMSDPRIAQDPQGFEIAAKLAYADIALQKAPATNKTVNGLKAQLKKVQAATMIEGGGRKAGSENPSKKLVDRVRETGRIEDGAAVLGKILRAQGQIKD